MNLSPFESNCWKWFFWSLLPLYALCYAPYGINETDGGFLTGLAWQLLNGKVLYQDIVYIRPPMPVFLRALEMKLLPEFYAVLGERWIFYLKVWLYSYMAACMLLPNPKKWFLATLGFIVSVHCYPAMAWHTVDGIFFAVLSAYLWFCSPLCYQGIGYWLAGSALAISLLCKQSFYPLLPFFGVAMYLDHQSTGRQKLLFVGGVASVLALWWVYLAQAGLIAAYISMTAGSTTVGQAVQHGLFDYWMITPELAIPSVLVMAFLYVRRKSPWSGLVWALWILALIWSYTAVTWLRQEHTAPFAQSRFLFLLAAGWMLTHRYQERGSKWSRKSITSLLLLSISWCASVSWGYSLPMLFAAPWIWGVFEISDAMHWDGRLKQLVLAYRIILVASLLFAFRVGYEFVYRDGKRSEMTEHLGAIFPKLHGIYSDRLTADKYRDLAQLFRQYGPNYAILPAFPQAHFLTGTTPPLPLDWVVNRESNGENQLIIKGLNQVDWIFIEKSYLEKIDKEPELSLTQRVLSQCEKKAETEYFILLNRVNSIQ